MCGKLVFFDCLLCFCSNPSIIVTVVRYLKMVEDAIFTWRITCLPTRMSLGEGICLDIQLVMISQLSKIIKGNFWVPLGGYPSSCSPNITPYCPIQPYRIHRMVVYVGIYLGYSPKGTQRFPWKLTNLLCTIRRLVLFLEHGNIAPIITQEQNTRLIFFYGITITNNIDVFLQQPLRNMKRILQPALFFQHVEPVSRVI